MHVGTYKFKRASLMALVVKNTPANTGDIGSVPGLGRSPGGRHGYLVQYSYLENLMDRGAGGYSPGCKESDMTEAS